MCIRDRQHTLLAAHAAVPQRGRHPADLVGQIAITQLPVVCLLYTSDAADERSSVDLGGRRIIKKKTTNDHVA